MRLLSFNPYRTLGVPGVRYVKPELVFEHRDELAQSDWVLFPEYWQVNFLAHALRKRIFPSAASYRLGHDKVEMTRALWALCPEHVPHTRIVAATPAGIEQVLDEMPFPFVTKEIRSAGGAGVRLVQDRAGFLDYAVRNPVLYVQEHLPLTRDLRVVHVGARCVAAYWRQGEAGAFLNNVARGGRISFHEVPDEAVALVERIATQLGVDHAGFDVAEVDGRYYLLEFNTLFGNHGLLQRRLPLGRIIFEHLQKCSSPPLHPDDTVLPRAG